MDTIRDIQGYLSSSSAITDLVPIRDIKVGWTKTLDTFPCIIITQAGGTDIGDLGYNTAAAGSKIRRETPIIQINICSRVSALETHQIADEVIPVLISGSSRKIGDFDDFNDDYNVNQKILTFSFTNIRED